MLRGIRTAIKYFTIGLLAGVLLAPRKGDETRHLLVDRGKEYVQEVMNANAGGQHGAGDTANA
jgi:gas vesicle protein